MPLKSIQWEVMDGKDCLWQGSTMKGLLSNVLFFVSPTGRIPDEYRVSASDKNIKETTCMGLEAAKEKAQDLLNSYDISLSIL